MSGWEGLKISLQLGLEANQKDTLKTHIRNMADLTPSYAQITLSLPPRNVDNSVNKVICFIICKSVAQTCGELHNVFRTLRCSRTQCSQRHEPLKWSFLLLHDATGRVGGFLQALQRQQLLLEL